MKKHIILFILLIHLIPVQTITAQNISLELNSNWQFRQQGKTKWYKATVPGTVHTDLLANKLIPDPYYRDNETKLQWIDKVNWEYKTTFNVNAQIFAKKNIELVFDGLDTYGDVYLNGELILQVDNMFRGWTVNVKPFIKPTNNLLLIKFSSAQNKVDSIAKSKLPLVLPDNNRVYVRKAQFQFGWDWGPKFVGCGIWKNVKLESWNDFKIQNSKFQIQNIENDTAYCRFDVELNSLIQGKFLLAVANGSFTLYPPLSALGDDSNTTFIEIGEFQLKEGENVLTVFPKIPKPTLWQYGKLNGNALLEIKYIIVSIPDKFISSGLKTAITSNKLIQQKDSIGSSFYFEKDGKPIYAKGANWIPADVFLPRLKKEDYRKILQSAKDANMNMLRVWGGGVYEADEFYEMCDSLDIMVWQDFMFAGGMYPGDDAFMNNVREEVKYQIKRLRNHPCIVLWCGNNEIDEAWHNWGWQNQFNLHGSDSANVWNDYKRLFEDSLKKWVDEFDGTRPYVSTSPKNGWGHKESFTEGDSHYWGVWWGLEDWEAFENKTGRFVSEYGMQAMPNINTIKTYTDLRDRYLYSPVINAHQKANEGFKKLNHYLTRYFIDSIKLSKLSLDNYTYLTQCLQYYILKNSIAIHRSKYPTNMGTLLWQLNDCWPVTSWSITDYSRQPKAAWYAVKEAYRDDVLPKKDTVYPKDLKLEKAVVSIVLTGNKITLTANADAKYIQLAKDGNTSLFSDNYFDMKKGESKSITLKPGVVTKGYVTNLRIKSLCDVLKN